MRRRYRLYSRYEYIINSYCHCCDDDSCYDDYYDDYLNELIEEEMRREMTEYDNLRITTIHSKANDEFDTHIKPDRHNINVKGIVCRSGRTARPVGRGNGWIIPNRVSDDSRQHPSRLLRVRKVRQCDCCRTHRCENNIPIRGRKIKVNDYIEDDN